MGFKRPFCTAVLFSLLFLGCIGGGGKPSPTPTPNPYHTPAHTPAPECISDSGCEVAGCADQWCVPVGGQADLPCRWNTWYECLQLTTCGCVEGTCDWKETGEFLACRENPVHICPAYSPASAEFTALCEGNGGEVTAIPDENSCTVAPICSSDISCSQKSDCPRGFACGNGVCVASELFCGGVNLVECRSGYRCAFGGQYYSATGACLKTCSSNGECGEDSACAEGLCTEPPEPECAGDSGCREGYRCVNGKKCRPVQGMACGYAGALPCGAGFYCKTGTICREGDTCTQIPGTCDATLIPENLSRLCNKPAGSIASNVTAIVPCNNSANYRVVRSGNRYGYADYTGVIFKECGASAPPADPICGLIDSECVPRPSVSCTALEAERFIHCPPAYSGNSDCPDAVDAVCALTKVGSVPALRVPEWVEFGNGCLACANNSPMRVTEGYWRGKCE